MNFWSVESGFGYLVPGFLCHHFSVHSCCATLNMKPQNAGYYFLFTISILELKNKGNVQVHTLFKMKCTIFLPLSWVIYCSSLKWTSCLQTDITHNCSHCQVLVWGPLRCLKSAIHICAGSTFVYFRYSLEIFSWNIATVINWEFSASSLTILEYIIIQHLKHTTPFHCAPGIACYILFPTIQIGNLHRGEPWPTYGIKCRQSNHPRLVIFLYLVPIVFGCQWVDPIYLFIGLNHLILFHIKCSCCRVNMHSHGKWSKFSPCVAKLILGALAVSFFTSLKQPSPSFSLSL